MNLDPESCYRALVTHDARFDGMFFVGVSSTKIYCRTVCTAKTPREENCSFYPSAAAAEKAGFRPCLRCRPELAPGNARVDAIGRLAAAAASRIEDGALTDKRIEELANELGVSDRHLRRTIQNEFGVTPVELAQTQRLLLAKRLLNDTELSIVDVAFASGFSSLRRFNSLFKERYRLSPSEMRKGQITAPLQDTLVCEVGYRPPLDWNSMLKFLAKRAVQGVEMVDGDRYLRTMALGRHRGYLSVRPSMHKSALSVELSASLAQVLSPALARTKRLFDLDAEPKQISSHLGPLAAAHPGLRMPGAFDGFETAVRAVLGQQVSVKAAATLGGRFVKAFGETIETPFGQLTHITPAPGRIVDAKLRELTSLGITVARAKSILALAEAVVNRKLVLDPGRDVQQTMAQLRELPGIGEWTAQYIAMRALSWPDAFPHTDLGIRKALGENDTKRILQIAQGWRPWRAYAVMHLWKSLEAQ